MKSIIYDVDGTLWDSTSLIAENWRRICTSYGYPCEHITASRLRQEFGKLLPDIGLSLFPSLPESQMLKLIRECCASDNGWLLQNRQPLYDGVSETIRSIHKKGLKQVIVSNCTEGYIETLIEIHHLESLIDEHLCAADTGLGKRDNIRIAKERWNLEEPVYVGDTYGDFCSSRDSGTPFVYAAYGFGDVPDPDYTIHSPRELLSLISA